MMELGWLALDYLAETLPPETMQYALHSAMQRRRERQEPQFFSTIKVDEMADAGKIGLS
jgi:hypothetical protein